MQAVRNISKKIRIIIGAIFGPLSAINKKNPKNRK